MHIRHTRAETMRALRSVILLLPLALLLCAACGGAGEEEDPPAAVACTMIGCESGVTVQLSGLPAVPFSVELTPAGGAATLKECVASDACGTELFFSGVSADSVTIKVTSGAGESVTRARAEYATTRPNGPQCDPECRQARVAASVPR